MPEEKRIKIINFLQDFGCARLNHLQILFDCKNNNLKSVLYDHLVIKKEDIFVHTTRTVNNKMLIALDILCKYKMNKRLDGYYLGYNPIIITFISNEKLKYHIIVADNDDNKKGIVKQINSYPQSIQKADKLILAFPTVDELEDISCKIPFLYCTYPNLEIQN